MKEQERRVRTDRQRGQRQLEERQDNKSVRKGFYNDHHSGQDLIQHIIDVIRHQEFVLDNIGHLSGYNELLLRVWKRQINLLDRYHRFQLYKQLSRLKQLMK